LLNYQKVVITGLGAVTPIGLNIEEYWRGLAEGKNGIAPITSFETSKYSVKLAGEVKGFKPEESYLSSYPFCDCGGQASY
jgi:3-oxoacyl-[acyl-carrier-protein] synthase II